MTRFEVGFDSLLDPEGSGFSIRSLLPQGGSLAEWSKALVLGTSPKGRGFESHSCQIVLPPPGNLERRERAKRVAAPGEARTHNPGISRVLSISTVR